MYPIKQSTAITGVFFAHDVNGDGVTAMADGGFTKRISKDGGAFAAMTVVITEMENGFYSFPLSAVHSDTLGILTLSFSHASAKRINLQWRVTARILDDLATSAALATVQADTDDIQTRLPAALVAGRIDASVGAVAANAITAAAIADGAIDALTFAAGAINAAAIAADAITDAKVAADVTIASVTGAVGSVTGAVGSVAAGGIVAASFAAGAINAAAIATGAIDADALAADAATEIRSLASGTSDSGTTTTMVDAARTEADTDYWKGSLIAFTSGTLLGQVRLITAFTPATDTITFAPATTVAAGTHTYEILPAARADVGLWGGVAVNALVAGRVDASVGAVAANAITAASVADGAIDAATFAAGAINAAAIAADAITDAKVAADVTIASVTGAVGSVTGAVGSVTGAVGSVTGAVGSVTGNVGGNVVGSVASVVAAVAITSNIKQNQALAAFEFLMTDSTTNAPKTGLVVTVTRSIDGGAFAAGTLSAVTEVTSGIYRVDFGAGDLNGKVIVLQATAAASDTTFERVVTQV